MAGSEKTMAGYGPLPLVPNVVKVVIENQGNDGRIADNVCHFTYGGSAPSSSTCVAIGTSFWSGWVTNLTPYQPAQTSITKVTVTDLSTDTGGEGMYDNAGTPVGGSSAHGMLPLHTCFLVSESIEQRYRGGHPRMYLPIGTTDDLNDDGDWKSASITLFVTAWETLVGSVIADNPFGSTNIGQQCAVSYVSKMVNPIYPYRRTTPLVYDIPLDGYSGDAKLATQRRRVRKTERRR